MVAFRTWIIVKPGTPKRMVTKGYRKGVYEGYQRNPELTKSDRRESDRFHTSDKARGRRHATRQSDLSAT
jgi:hypothetical protein